MVLWTEGAALYFSKMFFLGKVSSGCPWFSPLVVNNNKTRWSIRTRNLILSTIQRLNSALHSTYLVKMYIYIGVKGTMWRTTTQVATKGERKKGVHHGHVHGPRKKFCCSKDKWKKGLCAHHVHGPRTKKYSTITIHLPLTFGVWRAKGGRGCAGDGVEQKKV